MNTLEHIQKCLRDEKIIPYEIRSTNNTKILDLILLADITDINDLDLFIRYTTYVFYAAMNPNCPPKTLALILSKGGNNVSHLVTQNPNCPPQAVIEWARKTGKIKKYDPELHEITPNKNTDLEELDKLLDIH